MSVTANAPAANAQAMLDADPQTYTEFTVPADAAATAQIILTSEQPITSASLTFLLDSNVALPNSIAVHASDEAAGEKIIVAPRELGDQTIAFPKTTAKQWTITLSHSQLLRITELRLHQENAAKQSTNAVRFLAQPAHTYRVYFDPDRYSAPPVGEAGNLTSDTDVVILPAIAAEPNPAYVIADVDQDGVPDIRDNCVNIANADQQDKNANKRGDACDDFDRDGLSNTIDNCPDAPNRNQADADGDGLGDVCDTEESRLTERYAWLPWLGIGSAAVVLIILFTITGRSVINYRDHDKNSSPPPNVNAT
ncbi:MAG: thrombospondin type 3 repeat-containing protein [Candidatus Andersenbacteria bacterium]|nr:thrombospondin type 3 repeat-containing protein [Candidatus Andersenbacteria bacterium]